MSAAQQPAFPLVELQPHGVSVYDHHFGMTKREFMTLHLVAARITQTEMSLGTLVDDCAKTADIIIQRCAQ